MVVTFRNSPLNLPMFCGPHAGWRGQRFPACTFRLVVVASAVEELHFRAGIAAALFRD